MKRLVTPGSRRHLQKESSRLRTAPTAARGWERAARTPVHPYALQHCQKPAPRLWHRGFERAASGLRGEGPEPGPPHQPTPIPSARCSSHAVPGDLLRNLIRVSVISRRFDAPDKGHSRCFPLKFPLWEFSRDWYLLEARFKTGYFLHFLSG